MTLSPDERGSRRVDQARGECLLGSGTAPKGECTVLVNHYANHGGADPTTCQVTVRVDGRTRRFEGRLSKGDPKKVVHTFQLET